MLLVVILLYSLAGIFEAAGLLLAGLGFYRTWSEFGTGESLRGVTLRPPGAVREVPRSEDECRVSRDEGDVRQGVGRSEGTGADPAGQSRAERGVRGVWGRDIPLSGDVPVRV
jgi:hypothetical protein